VRDITEVLRRPEITKVLEQRLASRFSAAGLMEFEGFIASQSERWWSRHQRGQNQRRVNTRDLPSKFITSFEFPK